MVGGGEEITKAAAIEAMRWAYFIEGRGVSRISGLANHCRRPTRRSGTLVRTDASCKSRKQCIEQMIEKSKQYLRQQSYTARRISQLIKTEGYPGG